MDLINYIKETWPQCVRFNPDDDGTLIGLPHPYTVPSISGAFQEMYYWDTYFINRGLILLGNTEQAKNNVDNMLYLVEKYGFMPNGNRTGYLKGSQPPFLSLMVRDVYEQTADKAWLSSVTHTLIKEYEFWEKNRTFDNGLCRYYTNSPDDCEKSCAYFLSRIGKRPEGYTDYELGLHSRATCESGWDMSPRFDFEITDYAPVDLNSLMYSLENNIAFFLNEIGEDGADAWSEKAEKRCALMQKLMLKDGVMYDYNIKEEKISDFVSCALFYPMWLGLLNKDEAKKTAEILPLLETDFGILVSQDVGNEFVYQWGYPNGWAPLHLIVIEALYKNGFEDGAKRIAKKYVELVEKCFDQTQNLWEKYNVMEGNVLVAQEGDHKKMPAMMGWSAGVYIYCKNLLK